MNELNSWRSEGRSSFSIEWEHLFSESFSRKQSSHRRRVDGGFSSAGSLLKCQQYPSMISSQPTSCRTLTTFFFKLLNTKQFYFPLEYISLSLQCWSLLPSIAELAKAHTLRKSSIHQYMVLRNKCKQASLQIKEPPSINSHPTRTTTTKDEEDCSYYTQGCATLENKNCLHMRRFDSEYSETGMVISTLKTEAKQGFKAP